MKERKLFDAITDVKDDFIEEAHTTVLEKKQPKKWLSLAAIAACALFVAALGLLIPRLSDSTGDFAIMDIVFPKAYAFDDHDSWRQVIDQNPVDDSFLAAIDDFSYVTASQLLSSTKENSNYSPLSLYYALSIAATGAEGQTAEELLNLLGVDNKDTLATQAGNLYRLLYTDNNIGKLKIANSLWLQQDLPWKDPFVQSAAQDFYTSVHSVNFTDPATGKAMGDWVKEHTNGTLSPQIETNSANLLSILNTVYFYDQWIDRFDKSKTKGDTFYLANGDAVTTDFMNQTRSSSGFSYGDGFLRSQLALKNKASMVFVLPDEGVSPQELLSTPERMKEVFTGGTRTSGEVIWQVPKFNFGSKFQLKDTLQTLGVSSAFTEQADFSPITDDIAFINSIQQETHIAIDEKGVEAAAFTQILYAGAAPPNDNAEMILNRPFLYGIVSSNGTLLFVGVCENPMAN